MNKFLFFLLLMVGSLTAQNIMMVADTSGSSGDTIAVRILISNDSSFVAFQTDLQIPAELVYIQNSAVLSSRSNGHIVSASLLSGNILRLIAFSLNQSSFTGSTGEVARFKVKLGKKPGVYPLALINPIISNRQSQNILTGSENGEVTIFAPDININTEEIDFGRVPWYTSPSASFQISNYGTLPLQVSRIYTSSSYFRILSNTSAVIQPGSSFSVSVLFSSFVSGVYSEKVTIISDDPDQPNVTVNLKSESYSVDELHIGEASGRSAFEIELPVSVNNMEMVTGLQFDLLVPSALQYNGGGATLSSRKKDHIVSVNEIAPGRVRVIAFSPLNQAFSDSLGELMKIRFLLNGTGGTYGIYPDSVYITTALAVNIASTSYSGTVTIISPDISGTQSAMIGETPVTDTLIYVYQVDNAGSDTLLISNISSSSEYFTPASVYPIVIAPGFSGSFELKFYSATKGTYSGRLYVRSNDPDEDPFFIDVSASAFFPNYMRIPALTTRVGDTITVSLHVDNYEEFVAFQTDISLPADFQYIPGSAVLTNRKADHLLNAGIINATTIRLFAFSLTQAKFSGNSGAVAELKYLVGNTPGQSEVVLSASVLSDPKSQNILKSASNGQIMVYPIPMQPGLLFPENGAVSVSLTPLFEWSASTGSEQYQMQLTSDAQFQNLIKDSILAELQLTTDSLEYLTTYHWRVRGINQGGVGTWSQTFSFTTIIEKPANVSLSAPANNSKGMVIPVKLSWNSSLRANKYFLQVSEYSDFRTFVIDDTTQTDTSESLTSLNYYKEYFWRVKAMNAGGESDWSETRNFTTLGNPYSSTLYQPVNNSANQPISGLIFKWSRAQERVESIQKYQLQISSDSLFASFIYSDTTLTDTIKEISDLSYLTKYWWRVRASNQAGWGDWSESFNFMTIIQRPGLVEQAAPLNGTVNNPIDVWFFWYPALRAEKYQIQLALDAQFTQVLNDTIGISQPLIIPGLQYFTMYYWRIRAINIGGEGDWSPAAGFKTMPEKPNTVTLAYPLNNTGGMQQPFIARWNKSLRANYYKLQVSADSAFSSLTIDNQWITDTALQISQLGVYTKYFWRVKAVGDGGESEWSAIWNFKTLGNPYSCTLFVPANNSVNQPTNGLVFKWSKAQERIETIQKYQFQLATDAQFTNIVQNDSTLTDTTKTINDLSYLTTYYWKVRAQNQTGWGDWSIEWKTTTIIEKPANLTLSAPANNSKGLLNPVTVTWAASARADRYILQVSTSSSFTSFVVNDSSQTDLTEELPTLNNYTQYHWRVKSVNVGGQSEWTEVWNFKTLGNPYTSTLYIPANNSVNQPITGLVFKWSKAQERIETIQKYQFQLATDTLFVNIVLDDSTLTDTSKTVSDLNYSAFYYWRVRAQNETGWGEWSAVWHFSTIIKRPENFTLISPANNSTGLLNPVTVTWNFSARAQKYILQVSTSNDFSSFVVNDSLQSGLNQELPPLNNHTLYYWRMRAINFGGTSDWTEVWNFKTLGNPYASTLYTPANNSVNQPITGLVFKWSKAQERIETTQKYQFQLATDAQFINIVQNDSTLTDTTKTINDLPYLTTYYWRVRAQNQTGWGDWSEVWNTTTIIEKPANFTLHSPVNNSKGLVNPVTVRWNSSLRAVKYILQVSITSDFSTYIVNDSTFTDTVKILSALNNFTQYYWRVRAINPGGLSEWTDIWNFKTLGNPYASTLYIPANNSVNQPITGLVFKWSKAQERIETIQKYQLQISTDSLFNTLIQNDTTLTDTTKTVDNLTYLTKYYWRVRAQNQSGWGEWSAIWTTITIIEKPAVTVLASPANNAAQLLQLVTLKWNRSPRADIYRLEVSEFADFSFLILVDSTLTDSMKVLPQLENPKTYYWRLISSNIGGVSDYSAVWNFRTLGKPLTVTLATPAHNSMNHPVTGVRLSWLKPGEQTMAPLSGGNNWSTKNDDELSSTLFKNTSKGKRLVSGSRISSGHGIEGGESILAYWLQMSSDTSGGIYIISDSTLADTFKVLPSLNYLTSYYWRVKAKNENGWSEFSGWYRFTTIIERPSQPVLASPANNALGLLQPVTVKWYSSLRAEKYSLEVSTAENFSTVVHRDTSVTDTAKVLPVLSVYTKFYWRVAAKNVGGTSDTSAIFSFKTLGAPGVISLVTPAQNAQNVPVANILFNWTKAYDRIETILAYRFELKTDTTQSGYIVLDSLLTDTVKTVTSLLHQTGYYWRVGAKNEAGWSEPTPWNKFTTIIAAPVQVTLSQPANNAVNIGVRPQFTWNKVIGAERYRIEISATQEFTAIILQDSLVTDTVKAFTDSLLFNIKYYWRVKASNIGGSGNYSVVWNFTTTKRSINAPSNLTAAATGVKQISLSWTDKSDNESGFIIFRKQGDSTSTNTLTAIDTSGINSTQYVDTTVATDPLLYSYLIIAYNPDTISTYSNYAVVTSLTGVGEITFGIPMEYNLFQNYPNPFNPSTTIRYGLPHASEVRLEIFDISGQKLRTLVDEAQSAGYYEVVFDISEMSSGTYLYVLTARQLDGGVEFHKVKKTILLK